MQSEIVQWDSDMVNRKIFWFKSDWSCDVTGIFCEECKYQTARSVWLSCQHWKWLKSQQLYCNGTKCFTEINCRMYCNFYTLHSGPYPIFQKGHVNFCLDADIWLKDWNIWYFQIIQNAPHYSQTLHGWLNIRNYASRNSVLNIRKHVCFRYIQGTRRWSRRRNNISCGASQRTFKGNSNLMMSHMDYIVTQSKFQCGWILGDDFIASFGKGLLMRVHYQKWMYLPYCLFHQILKWCIDLNKKSLFALLTI